MGLTDQQLAELYETTKATNAAVGRLEVAVRDQTSGIQSMVTYLLDGIQAMVNDLVAAMKG